MLCYSACIGLCYIVLQCVTLCYIVLHSVILCYNVLHWITLCFTVSLYILPLPLNGVRSLVGEYLVVQDWKSTWCDGALVLSLTTGCRWESSSNRNLSTSQTSPRCRNPLSPQCSSAVKMVLETAERGRAVNCQFYSNQLLFYSPSL